MYTFDLAVGGDAHGAVEVLVVLGGALLGAQSYPLWTFLLGFKPGESQEQNAGSALALELVLTCHEVVLGPHVGGVVVEGFDEGHLMPAIFLSSALMRRASSPRHVVALERK